MIYRRIPERLACYPSEERGCTVLKRSDVHKGVV